jgi:hypothetical protein
MAAFKLDFDAPDCSRRISCTGRSCERQPALPFSSSLHTYSMPLDAAVYLDCGQMVAKVPQTSHSGCCCVSAKRSLRRSGNAGDRQRKLSPMPTAFQLPLSYAAITSFCCMILLKSYLSAAYASANCSI